MDKSFKESPKASTSSLFIPIRPQSSLSALPLPARGLTNSRNSGLDTVTTSLPSYSSLITGSSLCTSSGYVRAIILVGGAYMHSDRGLWVGWALLPVTLVYILVISVISRQYILSSIYAWTYRFMSSSRDISCLAKGSSIDQWFMLSPLTGSIINAPL